MRPDWYRRAVALAAGGLLALAISAPAAAHHNVPELIVGEPGECGKLTITTAWPLEEHQVHDHRRPQLVVQIAGEQHAADIGESITIGPFEAEQVNAQIRIWGGGERGYDVPQLADLDALLEHLAEDESHSPLDPGAPGLAWQEMVLYGCPAEEEEGDETPSPSPEPTKPGEGEGEGDGKGGEQLPVTGASTGLLAGGALGLLTLGGGLWMLARRRGVSFTA